MLGERKQVSSMCQLHICKPATKASTRPLPSPPLPSPSLSIHQAKAEAKRRIALSPRHRLRTFFPPQSHSTHSHSTTGSLRRGPPPKRDFSCGWRRCRPQPYCKKSTADETPTPFSPALPPAWDPCSALSAYFGWDSKWYVKVKTGFGKGVGKISEQRLLV